MTATADADLAADADCLDRWIATRDADAFATLTRRHVDLVHAAAARQLAGDAALADDVTQAVFLVLARRPAQARRSRSLAAWLHVVTRHAVANARRGERRRSIHEARAAALRPEATMPHEPADDLRSILDDAIADLGDSDRTAIVERYLNGRDVAAVASMLGASTEATQKRIERAVAKLRRWLAERGAAVAVPALVAILAATPDPAPAHIAANVVAPNATAVALAKRTMIDLSIAKAKAAAQAIAPVLLLGGVATLAVVAQQMATLAPPLATTRAAAAGRLTATLPGGVSVTLLGVGEPQLPGSNKPASWWTPDGTAGQATHAPLDWGDGQTYATGPGRNGGLPGSLLPEYRKRFVDQWLFDLPDSRPVEFVVDVRGVADDALVEFNVPERWAANPLTARVPQAASSPAAPRRYAYLLALQDRLATARLRVRIAAGEPRLLADAVPRGNRFATTLRTLAGGEIRVVDPSATPQGMTFRIETSPDVPETYRIDVRATDRSGVVRAPDKVESDRGDWRVTFADRSLGDVAKIEVVGVPYHWVEFRDLALSPGTMTTPEVVTTTPAVEAADETTPRAALMALGRAQARGDAEAERRLTFVSDEAGRLSLEASLRSDAASRALKEAVRVRLGEEAALEVSVDDASWIADLVALPTVDIQITGDRASVPMVSPHGPPTPMRRIEGTWKIDLAEYIRLCGSDVAEEEAVASARADALEALTRRVERGEIETVDAFRRAHRAAVMAGQELRGE